MQSREHSIKHQQLTLPRSDAGVRPGLKSLLSGLVRVLLSAVLTLCVVRAVCAQDPDGHSPNRGFSATGSYVLSDIECISLSGGNMTYAIPLAALPPSRGGKLKPAVNLLYNSKIYDTRVTIASGTNSYTQTDLVRAAWGGWHYGVWFSLDVTDRSTNYLNGAPEPQNTYKWKAAIVFPDGSKHTIRPYGWAPPPGEDYYSVNPGQAGAQEYYSTDSLYFRVHITSHPGALYPYDFTIYLADGAVVDYNAGVQTVTDSNGNFFTVQNVTLPNGNPATQVTDQLGRKITIETPLTSPDYVRVNGYNAQELVTTVNWGTTHPQGKRYLWREADAEVWKNLPTQFPVVTGITLPNTLAYQFAYNSDIFDPAFPSKSVGWGDLYRTTLPTGAIAQYSYDMDYKHDEADNVIPMDVLRDYPTQKQLNYTDTYDGVNTSRVDTWSYGIAFGQNTSPVLASVTDPDLGLTTETFFDQTAGPDFEGVSYKTTYPDGSLTERIWQLNIPPNANGSQINLTVKTEFTTVVNSAGTPVKTAIKDFTNDKNGNLTQLAEYDWVNYGDVPRTNGRPTGIPGTATVKRVTVNNFYNPTSTTANIYNQTTAPNLRRALKDSEGRSGFADTTVLSRAEMVYDNASTTGNLTQEKHWDSTKGPISRDLTSSNWVLAGHSYDTFGNCTLTTDPRGNQTQFTYGAINGFSSLYPTEIKAAFGSPVVRTSDYEYDFSTGAVKKVTDVDNNVTTQTSYDQFARPTLVQEAYNVSGVERRTVTEYSDSARRVIVRADLNSTGDGKLVSIQHYDQLGRLRLSRTLEDAADDPNGTDETKGIKVQSRYLSFNPSNPADHNSYRLVSNPYRAATSGAASSENTMGWTRSKMDQMGRVIEFQSFGGTSLPAPWGTSTSTTGTVGTVYDSNTTTVTDQAGKQRRSVTDALGSLTQVVEDPSGVNYATDYGYDALNDLTGVTQAQASPAVTQSRSFIYDSLKRLTDATNPESGHVHYTYDDNANLKTKTDALSPAVVTTYFYDALNRVTSRTYSDSTLPVSFYYDAQTLPYTPANFTRGKSSGRLVAATYGSGSTNGTYTGGYDELGRLTVSVQRTELLDYRFGYVYNLAGAMTSETYPSGRVVATAYDPAGRINQISGTKSGEANKTYASQFSYTPVGAVSAMSMSNGAMTEQTTYNSRLQPTQIELRKVSGSVLILGLDYSYGATNTNNGNISSQTIRIGINAPFIDGYSYDSLNRLSQATETLNSTQQWQQIYDIDRWGNRALRSTSYVPMSNNGLTPLSAGPTDFSAFNQSTNRLSNNIQSQANVLYDNAGNQTRDAGGKTFAYDAENRLATFNGGAGQYSYDGDGRRVKKIDNSGTTVFVYNAGGQLIAEYHSDPVPSPAGGGGTSYLTTDHLGSTRVVTKPDGTVKARYDYLPFGEEIESSIGGRSSLGYGSPDSTKQKFTQKERDSESGLDYFGARYYSSAQGRFTGADDFLNDTRAKDPSSWNLYVYVRNNPLVYVDAGGEEVNSANLTDDQKKQLIDDWKNKTGFKNIYFDGKNKLVIDVNSGFKGGSATARTELLSAVNSTSHVFNLRAVSGEEARQVAFADNTNVATSVDHITKQRTETYDTRIDFEDVKQLEGDRDAKKAFSIGLNVIHEFEHGLRDGKMTDNPRVLGIPGGIETFIINHIRAELGLARRMEYSAIRNLTGRNPGYAETRFAKDGKVKILRWKEDVVGGPPR